MLKKDSKITINKSKIDDNKRFKILDFIRFTLDQNFGEEETLRYLKQNIETAFGGKWQVAVGNKFTAYLNETYFPMYLDLSTRNMTFMIFSLKR